MKKITIALATAAALSAAGGVVLTVPEAPQIVQAAQDTTVTVSLIDEYSNRVITTFAKTTNSDNTITISKSELPSGYGFSNNLYANTAKISVGNSSSTKVRVIPITSYKVNLVDSATSKTIKQITVNLSSKYPSIDAQRISAHFPAGYSADYIIGDSIPKSRLNVSGPTDFYVSKSGFDNVKFVSVQQNTTVSTGRYDNSRRLLPSVDGYKTLLDQGSYAFGGSYGELISSVNGTTVVKVRPDLSNKTVPARFVDSKGKLVSSGTVTFDSNESMTSSTLPSHYYMQYNFASPESYDANGLVIQVKDVSGTQDTENNSHDASSSALQSQYNDLLAKYNALNTTDVASLAKELASLKSQMATMQAEIAALQYGSKATTKQLSITGTATVSGAKATVYNSKFAKTGRKLNVNSKWKVFGIVVASNGHAYFNIGGGQYIPVSAAPLHATTIKGKADTSIPVKTKATIKYKPGYSVQVWGKNFANFAKNANGSNKKLKHGTSWKVFAIVKHNGHLYYDLGGTQYLDAAYATIK
ncbi:SLAP domain-containing protein [Lacticaseibacillus zhaodongensis]|uniref:SLAP domain-containing protein n=1 Tax=Lacticaseibacillus zhaodongensis TaxID=2668065 RepID=UPI0012D2E232|nr:SLAP domain-containing protein [Lacticaseibacillus zhaodongensis]